ncbi:MAG: AMP-binding protein [Bacteroidales bacterium]|nr:AMP-binding protein [Bacteroidales bacterium]
MGNKENFRKIFESQYTWIEGFMRNVRRYSSRNAMICPDKDRTWSYAGLNADVNRLCHALLKDGVGREDVVMFQLLNCPEFVFAYIACHKIHAVGCPASFRLSAGELAQAIDDSKPVVLVFDSVRETAVLEALSLSSWSPKRLVVTDGSSHGNIMSYEDYVKDEAETEPENLGEYSIYDETVRLYTSGTTGKQKGVPLTSINEVLSAHDVMIHFPMNYKDVSINTTPWFHRGGLHCAGPCPTFYAGASLVIMSKFKADATLQYVQKYGITFVIGVPTVLEALADEQEKKGYDLKTLKGIVTMGSPLERSACIRYQSVLTPNIYNGYGTTESFWNTFLRPFDLPDNAGTAGASCVDDDVRVVKVFEDRRAEPDELAAMDGSEIGEVIIKSPAKSPYAYHDNPEETERKYHQGFLYTNDLGTWDKNQFVTIVGRKDDMIISSGENIYPVQIEEVLNCHPKVRDCMVTAAPDKIRGQIVTAYVVRSDASLTADELDQFCKDSPDIANFKRPRYYRFVEELPVNATGKKLHYKMKMIAENDLKNGLLQIV